MSDHISSKMEGKTEIVPTNNWSYPTCQKWWKIITWKDKPKFYFSLLFKWYDFWVGFYYDRNSRTLYFFPIPMFGIKIEIRQR